MGTTKEQDKRLDEMMGNKCANCNIPKQFHGNGKYCPQSYGYKIFEPKEDSP
jgi:hypothetical protein